MTMKGSKYPIRGTIIYGLICGLSFIPLALTLNALTSWSGAVDLTLWLFIAGYAILLNIWGEKIQISTVFPLLLLLPAIFLTDSIVLFFILALMITSWIRSGICFQKTGTRGIAVELLLGFSGGLPVIIFTPGSVNAWVLCVWMFFLVQALYFVFFEPAIHRRDSYSRMDAFEKASRQAEKILTDIYYA